MKRTRLYNTFTGKWEYWTLCRGAWRPLHDASVLLRLLLRRVRGRAATRRGPAVYDFDEETLGFSESGSRRFRMMADAVLSMVFMQKFIK